MAIGRAPATPRTAAIRAACSACVPCEKFTRKTSTPASTSARIPSSEDDAGPSVATIRVRAVGEIPRPRSTPPGRCATRSEEHTSELQSLRHLVCRLLLEKKKKKKKTTKKT